MNLTIAETLSHLPASLFVPLEVEDRDIVDVITDPTILCLATLESASLAIEAFLKFSFHVEDEDDEKYVGQLKLNHSKCF